MKKIAQSSLEATIAFLAGTMLLGAGIAIWAWGNAQVGNRQPLYTLSRFAAGQPARTVTENGAAPAYKFIWYPIYKSLPLIMGGGSGDSDGDGLADDGSLLPEGMARPDPGAAPLPEDGGGGGGGSAPTGGTQPDLPPLIDNDQIAQDYVDGYVFDMDYYTAEAGSAMRDALRGGASAESLNSRADETLTKINDLFGPDTAAEFESTVRNDMANDPGFFTDLIRDGQSPDSVVGKAQSLFGDEAASNIRQELTSNPDTLVDWGTGAANDGMSIEEVESRISDAVRDATLTSDVMEEINTNLTPPEEEIIDSGSGTEPIL